MTHIRARAGYNRMPRVRHHRGVRIISHLAEICGFEVEPGYTVLVLSLPVSKNAEGCHPMQRRRMKEDWANFAWTAWHLAGRPGPYEHCAIDLVFWWPDKRKRDMDNFLGLWLKGALDGLKGRMMPDDSYDRLEIGAKRFYLDREYPRLELHILKTEGGENDAGQGHG